MCGIVGFISLEKEEDLIKKLTNSLSHRGPDESDYSIIELDNYFIHLGSTRLSIVGNKDGKMPMKDSENNQIVYNGELYDLEKLSKLLDKKLSTNSDTKYLFEFLKKFSYKKLSELNGMFAFGFFDAKNKSVILGRDKLGIKPLFYLKNEKYPLIFCSEIKPLLSNNFSKRIVSNSNLNNFILFSGVNKFSNLLTDIKSLQPGSYLFWKDSKLEIGKYFELSKSDVNNELDLETLLYEAIEDQLKADVNVDILLSGGIDSSIIAYISKKILQKDVTAFSLSFDNNKYDESFKASTICKELSINHEIIDYNTELNYEVIEELMEVLPEPIGDPSIVPTYYLNKQVSKKTKAVLSGDGADELFSGYDWYRALIVSPFIKTKFKSLLMNYGKFFDQIIAGENINLTDKLTLYFNGVSSNKNTSVLHWQNTFFQIDTKKIEDIFANYVSRLNLESSSNRYDATQLIDLQTYLYSNILKKSDTASMLNGLEVRPVFLDDRILDYSMSKNQSQNVSLFKSKKELRGIVSNYSKLSSQKKQGFSHDFGNWTQEVGVPYLIKNKNEYELLNFYMQSLDNNHTSSTIYQRNVWKLYCAFKWLEINNVNIEN